MNPEISGETVICCHGLTAALSNDRLQLKIQIHPRIREGAPQEEQSNCLSQKRKENLVIGPRGVADTKMDWLWPSVANSTSLHFSVYAEVLRWWQNWSFDFVGITRFEFPWIQNSGFWNAIACMYIIHEWVNGQIFTPLMPEWSDGFYFYSVFKSLSITGQCLVIWTQKIRALQMGLRIQNCDFLENGCGGFH